MTKLLNTAVEKIKGVLGTNLVGIYLHGSLVMDCFNPDSSDIDVLVVVKDYLDLEAKQQMIKTMLALSEQAPPGGFELNVVTQAEVRRLQVPTPCEFQFSNELYAAQQSGAIDLTNPLPDTDIVANIAMIRARGTCLNGEPIEAIFPPVPKEVYLRSLKYAIDWSLDRILGAAQEGGTCRVPAYGVLNFSRVLALIKADLVLSKAEGGAWALTHVPEEYHAVIQEALGEYKKADSSREVDVQLLKGFARYTKEYMRRSE